MRSLLLAILLLAAPSAYAQACIDTPPACAYGEKSCVVCQPVMQSVPGTTSYCGDAKLDTANGEKCDDGNVLAWDGCSPTCTIEVAVCGNGHKQGTEACDDGNLTPGDGCSATCTIEVAGPPVCGDGIVQAGEQCDDGNLVTEACVYGDVAGHTVCGGGSGVAAAAVTLNNTAPANGRWTLAGLEIKAGPGGVPAIDTVKTSATTGPGPAPVSGFTTSVAGDLVVAFVSFDAPREGAQTATVTGGGLAWTLVRRSSAHGTAEVWTATAPGALAGVTITATPLTSARGMLHVVAFKRAAGVGASAIASAATGLSSITVPGADAGSWVWAVGMDYTNATARGYPAGQTKQVEILAPGAGTFWVQSTTAPSASGAGCRNVACAKAYCGDRVVQTSNGEQCDDGNTTAGDGCEACRVPVVVPPAPLATLRWTSPTPAPGVTAFRIYRSETAGVTGPLVYEGYPQPVDGIYTRDVPVSVTKPSYFRATAYNASGASALSNEISLPPR